MTKVAILPVATATGHIVYHAMAGDKQSHGNTAGEALDALTTQLQEEEVGTLVIVQNFHPDSFSAADQQRRLAELMARWRAARDVGTPLPTTEQAELDALIEAEIRASTKRTAALLHELTQ
jgi:hypothetical protein